MICYIFKSERKQGAYLYLAENKSLGDVPDELQTALGSCVKVMQLDLNKIKKLASQDIETVKENLNDQGYHLQMPPKNQVGIINYGV